MREVELVVVEQAVLREMEILIWDPEIVEKVVVVHHQR